ncbi:MAG: aminotransferase class I/II-fold pyridoxal phosphate-dependent enzyme [Leptospira sp.]|nr:aminotransferase class I/II-fold pyridoxal phosphate-dependent enzyme [Leptospira sp.]
MGVPFIDIKRFETGFLDEWTEKVSSLSKTASFIGGPEVAGLEKSLSEYCEVAHTVSCANGTDALQLALRAVGVGRGDKVLLPDSTFWATFEAVVNVNGDPYTVDTDKADLQMNFSDFEKAIEPNAERTKLEAILKEAGIGFGNIYPGSMTDQPGAKEFQKGRFGKENAREISSSVLNLPLFPYMTEAEFSEVISAVKRHLGKN